MVTAITVKVSYKMVCVDAGMGRKLRKERDASLTLDALYQDGCRRMLQKMEWDGHWIEGGRDNARVYVCCDVMGNHVHDAPTVRKGE